MALAESVVEKAMQLARAGSAAALALAIGTAPNAAASIGLYADTTAAAERLALVVGGIDGAAFARAGNDVSLKLQAGIRDGIALAPSGSGIDSRLATLTTAALSGSVTYTFPAATLTVAGQNYANIFSANQTIAAGYTLSVASDTDVTTTLGRARVGYDGTNTNTATFAHYDVMTTSSYALAQTSVGTTMINAAPGRAVSIRIANATVVTVDASSVVLTQGLNGTSATFTGSLTSASDTDVTTILGRAKIGYDGANSDAAMFAHHDFATNAGKALSQSNVGATLVNAASGQSVTLRIAAAAVMTVTGSAVTVAQPVTVSSGSIFVTHGGVFAYSLSTSGQPTFFSSTTSASEGLSLKFTEDTVGTVPVNTWQFRTGGTARNVAFSYFDVPIVTFGTSSGTGGVDVANNLTVAGKFITATATPASAADTGITGTVTWDTSYLYVCTATNTWKRVAIATW